MLFDDFMKATGYENFPDHTPTAVLHINEVRETVAKYAIKTGGELAFLKVGTKLIENYNPKNFNRYTSAAINHYKSEESPLPPSIKYDREISSLVLDNVITESIKECEANMALAEKAMEAVRVLSGNAWGHKVRIDDESPELVLIRRNDNSMTQQFFKAHAPDMSEHSREAVKANVLMQIINHAEKLEKMSGPRQQVA